jgi:hypothetical protein
LFDLQPLEYQLHVASNTKNERINAVDLFEFLQKFRAAYVVALSFVEYELHNKNIENYYYRDAREFAELENSFRRFLRSNIKLAPVSVLSKQHLRAEIDLEFESISKNSPLKFIGYCTGLSMLALSLAVALAGGEVDLKNQTFKVQPLSKAVIQITRELRK